MPEDCSLLVAWKLYLSCNILTEEKYVTPSCVRQWDRKQRRARLSEVARERTAVEMEPPREDRCRHASCFPLPKTAVFLKKGGGPPQECEYQLPKTKVLGQLLIARESRRYLIFSVRDLIVRMANDPGANRPRQFGGLRVMRQLGP